MFDWCQHVFVTSATIATMHDAYTFGISGHLVILPTLCGCSHIMALRRVKDRQLSETQWHASTIWSPETRSQNWMNLHISMRIQFCRSCGMCVACCADMARASHAGHLFFTHGIVRSPHLTPIIHNRLANLIEQTKLLLRVPTSGANLAMQEVFKPLIPRFPSRGWWVLTACKVDPIYTAGSTTLLMMPP